MKGVVKSQVQTLCGVRFREAKRLVWLIVALPLGLLCLVIIGVGRDVSAVTNESQADALTSSLPLEDYSRFSHSSPKEHADLMGRENCASCHRRSDGSLEPGFPLHKDCTGCHLVQFTASNSSSTVNPICTVCHKAEGLNSSTAPLKIFPRLVNFAVSFDHAQHLRGIESARPEKGCSACHTPTNRGLAETIPARLNAHQICYDCHSPGKQASKFSSCGSCHTLGPYSPTSTVARAYRLGFSHADHGPRERLTCDRCHNVQRRGLPQTRQVSSIVAVQHLSNARTQGCLACHNGQRAFGESANFTECGRCHKRAGFRTGE